LKLQIGQCIKPSAFVDELLERPAEIVHCHIRPGARPRASTQGARRVWLRTGMRKLCRCKSSNHRRAAACTVADREDRQSSRSRPSCK
jgi:hypothetical protein